MTDYAPFWQAQDLQHAMFLIDTKHDGDAFWEWGKARAEELRAYLPWPDAEVIVDYGCGVGRVLRHMPGKQRIGLDVSATMLAWARQFAPDCAFVLCDGRSMPLADNSMDFLYSLLVLQHMDADDVSRIVDETKRVLKPGGTFCHLFSRFGLAWQPGLVLPRHEGQWPGTRDGASGGAHSTIAYPKDVVESFGKRFRKYAILESPGPEVCEEYRYWLLWGRK